MEPQAFLFIITTILIYWLAFSTIPPFLLKRALVQVVGIFRAQGALSPESARTIHEMGLTPRGLLENIGKTRDYKPAALQLLMHAQVIVRTYDDRIFLSERKLRALCDRDRDNRLGICRLVRRYEVDH